MENTHSAETPAHTTIESIMNALFNDEVTVGVEQLDLFVRRIYEIRKDRSVYGATKHTELSYVNDDDYREFINLVGATDGTKHLIVIEMSLLDDFSSTVVPDSKSLDVLRQVRNYLRFAVNRIGRTQMTNQPLESFLADYVQSTFTLNGLFVHSKKQKDCMLTYIYWK